MSKKKKVYDFYTEEIDKGVDVLGRVLGETHPHAEYQLRVMFAVNGQKFMTQTLAEVGLLKKAGNLPTKEDGTPRTLGGAFFKIAKGKMTSSKRYKYFFLIDKKRKNKRKNEKPECVTT